MTPEWKQAVQAGDRSALERHLAAGQDLDARDHYGQTGLMLAAIRGDAETTAWFAEHGVDLDHTAKFGLTALMLAVVNRHRDVVDVLVTAGADRGIGGTGASGFAGKTALDLAAEQGDEVMVRMLSRDDAAHR